ncbi:MAG TPA: radical SAM protein [Patescibacteria group bacterium]|nr:radical SAM protein [Patescibacteria group bacterium]
MYRPKTCSIELFRRCCLRCRMCYMWKTEEQDGGLDAQTLMVLADQLQEVLAGEKEVVFSGGEPLLHGQIVDVINLYSRKGFRVGLASNGVLITKDKAAHLAQAGLKSIQLSFDSAHPHTHDFLRGIHGAHEKVLQAAEYLSAHKDTVRVCAQTVISGKNMHEILDTIRFVKDDGRFAYITFMAVTTPFFAAVGNDWMEHDEFSFLWPREKQLVDETFDRMIEMKERGYPIANPVAQLELFRAYFHNPRQRKEGIRCLLGDYVVSIDPAGDVRICCFMEPVGNIKKDPLADMLAEPGIAGLRQQMRTCDRVCNTLVNCFFRESTDE